MTANKTLSSPPRSFHLIELAGQGEGGAESRGNPPHFPPGARPRTCRIRLLFAFYIVVYNKEP
jgi:hypothetical protein